MYTIHTVLQLVNKQTPYNRQIGKIVKNLRVFLYKF